MVVRYVRPNIQLIKRISEIVELPETVKLIGIYQVMEVFVQVANNALHGRTYVDNSWTSDWYDIDGTPGTVSTGTSIAAATIEKSGGSADVLLAYVSKNKFLTVQSRTTFNVTEYGSYSTPKQLTEGDGSARTGLAIAPTLEGPNLYFVNNQTILELSASDVASTNWTTIDVTVS